jgi:hypothetical protein
LWRLEGVPAQCGESKLSDNSLDKTFITGPTLNQHRSQFSNAVISAIADQSAFIFGTGHIIVIHETLLPLSILTT